MENRNAQARRIMEERAIRQRKLEELTARNYEITMEIDTLRSGNEKKRVYTLLAGLSTVFLYFLLIILVVSLLQSGGLNLMFTYFLGWTIAFSLALVGLCIPLYKIRKFNKSTKAQVAAYQEELERNEREIAALRNG